MAAVNACQPKLRGEIQSEPCACEPLSETATGAATQRNTSESPLTESRPQHSRQQEDPFRHDRATEPAWELGVVKSPDACLRHHEDIQTWGKARRKNHD